MFDTAPIEKPGWIRLCSQAKLLLVLLLGCTRFPVLQLSTRSAECIDDYDQCLATWKQQRVHFLAGVDGYLNLAGLYWLREGVSTFGSDSSNDLLFPHNAAPSIGKFTLANGIVTMTVSPDINVRLANRPVRQLRMQDDTTTNPAVVSHGSLSWTVIQRDDRFAIRLRDFEHPSLRSFAPIGYFEASQDFRVSARLNRYPEPRVVRVDTVIAGLDYNPRSPGVVTFDIQGQSFELEAYAAGNELFIVFGDQTSGRETYPAGRFLYAPMPGADGIVTLDFNTAHNPPCAFNEFATCPVASPRNRLRTRITAGEIYDPAIHH